MLFKKLRLGAFASGRFHSTKSPSVTGRFVPQHEPIREADIRQLEDFLSDKPNILVLTGAGISTESGRFRVNPPIESPSNSFIPEGIPDYRSEGVGLYARSTSRPVQYNEFIRSPDARKRYCARNFVGWPRFSNCQSNFTHIALSRFERDGRLSGIVTQNVDRLHSKAGSQNVVEVHGSAYDVMCLGCDYTILRHDFQNILNSLNRNMIDRSEMVRPDGDVEIPQVSSLASSK